MIFEPQSVSKMMNISVVLSFEVNIIMWLLNEGLKTKRAFERSLSSVDSHVLSEMETRSAVFSTELTHTILLTYKHKKTTTEVEPNWSPKNS